jgi:hypothetical protein
MANSEPNISRLLQVDSDSRIEIAQNYVDVFRSTTDISTPSDWMTYIDILMGLYKGHEVQTPSDDLVVLEMVPFVHDTIHRGVNVARRYTPRFKAYGVMAYLKINKEGYDPIRAAILAGKHPSDNPLVKKVLKRSETRIISPDIKNPEYLNSDIDYALKHSCLPVELGY